MISRSFDYDNDKYLNQKKEYIDNSELDTLSLVKLNKKDKAHILIGYTMQLNRYLIPEWYKGNNDLKRYKLHNKWFNEQYKQLLISIPLKYIGNFLYYIVLPLKYFLMLSTCLTAHQPMNT